METSWAPWMYLAFFCQLISYIFTAYFPTIYTCRLTWMYHMPFLHPQAMCQIFANIFFGTHSNQTLSPNPPERHQNASKLSAGMMHGSTPFPLRVNRFQWTAAEWRQPPTFLWQSNVWCCMALFKRYLTSPTPALSQTGPSHFRIKWYSLTLDIFHCAVDLLLHFLFPDSCDCFWNLLKACFTAPLAMSNFERGSVSST